MLSQQIPNIREAVAKESKRSSHPLKFRVRGITAEKIFLYLELEPVSEDDQLSDQLEDCLVTWETANGPGRGEVVSVLAEIATLNVEWMAGPIPPVLAIIQVWPPKFLAKLGELWTDDKAAAEAIAWKENLLAGGFDGAMALDPSPFPSLRPMQRAAFTLPGWRNSFLWGPPGTGKTSTLGRLLAQYIVTFPTQRVLLLSTTNAAVDEALLAVEKGIKELGRTFAIPPCLRFGSRFDPDRYKGEASRLIPVQDKQLIDELRKLKAAAPKPAEVEGYYRWKEQRDALRAKIQREALKQLAGARVAGMTSTYAVLRYQDLQEIGKASLVVMDEASQIGKAYAMMLARLGMRCLFAGDPAQLSPIVQTNKCDFVRNWLGASPLGWMGPSTEERTVTLDEQFRMAAPINQAIQTAFYPGIDLRVADTVRTSVAWLAAREPRAKSVLGEGHICLLFVDKVAHVAQGFRGYECPDSVDVVIAVAAYLAKELKDPKERILILTPFRAQRAALDKRKIERGVPQTEVRTVHSVQGSEARFVILDPVSASSNFVNDEEGKKLLNVAMSRAQGQLIVILQRDFTANEVLRSLRAQFSDRRLPPEVIERGLSIRFEKPVAEPVVVPKATPPPAAPRKMAEEFRRELTEKLAGLPAQSIYRDGAFIDLARSAKYVRALTMAEKEAIFKEVAR
jgi:DNA replication ATP-dependent helicase Dna2